MIKSFRGQIADGGETYIRLGTNDGLTGYRIVKFQIIPEDPGNTSNESVVKVFSVRPHDTTGATTVTRTINFDDPTMLAVAFYSGNSGSSYPQDLIVIFDNTKFNQDIYLTHATDSGSDTINYYLELEKVKLDLNEATVATLKDMRGNE